MAEWFEQYGYLFLFLAVASELIILPISAEFAMSYAGYLVFLGKMSYEMAILTAILATFVGVTCTYYIGLLGGTKVINKYGKYIKLTDERFEKLRNWLKRRGSFFFVIVFYLPGIRHFPGYLAGITKVPFKKYALYSYVGGIIWVIVFVTMGRMLGKGFSKVSEKLDTGALWLLIFLVVASIIAYFFLKWKNRRKKSAETALNDEILMKKES